MLPNSRSPRLFLDTSVIIAAIMSPTGGARLLFHFGETGVFEIVVGKSVLNETDEVIRCKAPNRLTDLAQMLDETRIKVSDEPSSENKNIASALVSYVPDTLVLAEALQSRTDWFITHNREHFLNNPKLENLPFRIGTPGDVLLWQRERI